MSSPVVGQYPDGTMYEGDLPEDVANYSSLAAHAAKTEEDWEGELRGAEENRWGENGLLGALFDGLTEGVSFVVALIEGIGNAIFDAVSNGFNFVGSVITDALTWLGDLFSGKWLQADNTEQAAATANSQANSGYSVASNVNGGKTLVEQFSESAATTLTRFTRYSDGSGAGTYGPNGSGLAVWTRSGALYRNLTDVHTTALTTDYQTVCCVLGTTTVTRSESLIETPGFIRLLARVNSSISSTTSTWTYVYALISQTTVQVQSVTANGAPDLIGSASLATPPKPGDNFAFIAGTSTNVRNFLVKRNGVTVLDCTDSGAVSAYGSGYRRVGVQSTGDPYTSGGRDYYRFPLSMDFWAAVDRTAATDGLMSLADALNQIAAIDISGLQSDIDGKEPAITAGTSSQYWRGDKTWQTHNAASISDSTSTGRSLLTAASASAAKTTLSLNNVNNTADAAKNVLSARRVITGPYESGNYYCCNSNSAVGTSNSLTNGTLRMSPWVVHESITIDRLWVEHTAAGDAGSVFRIGIYDDVDGKPVNLVLDAGTVSTGGAAAVQEVTVSLTVAAGSYWVGGVVQGVTTTQPTMRTIGVAAGEINSLSFGTTLPSAGSVRLGYNKSGITGALPSTLSGLGYSNAATATPVRIGFRVA